MKHITESILNEDSFSHEMGNKPGVIYGNYDIPNGMKIFATINGNKLHLYQFKNAQDIFGVLYSKEIKKQIDSLKPDESIFTDETKTEKIIRLV